MLTLFRVLSWFSLPWLHRIGAGLGALVFLSSGTYRRHVRANLRQAMGNEGENLAFRVAIESGKQMAEIARVWLSPLDQVLASVREVRGGELVQAAREAGNGLVFLTPHLGCFEIVSLYLSQSAPISILYRKPKMASLQQLLEMGRARGGQKLAPADLSGVRTLIKALRSNEAVGLLPDQAPKTGEGVWLDFFGKPAYTMTLAARLSETKATTLLTWGERLPNGEGYRLHFQPLSTLLSGDTAQRAAQINEQVERLILTCPTQYLWGYNRYKRPAGADLPPENGTAK
jgi:Kdo2-lipid IVA lauroyltransferase/acyltransferase